MTRVVMVSARFFPHVGGAEKQALELSVALRARGNDVIVATRRAPGTLLGEEKMRGIRVFRLRRMAWPDAPSFMLALLYFLIKFRRDYDVIHVHLAGSPAVAAAIAGRLLKKTVIVKLGGGAGIGELAVSSRTIPGRLKLRLLARLRPRFVAVARDLAEEAQKYMGVEETPVVPNGVDVSRYKPIDQPQRQSVREKLGWPQGAVVFLYVGRLSEEKQLPRFIQAWAEVAGRFARKSIFVAVGEGPERPAMKTASQYARVAENVLFLPFTHEHPTTVDEKTLRLAQIYAAADVFVLPSKSEGLSNALLEAMACGLPALASRVGGTPDAVEDGISGLLFDPKDDEELKAKIERIFQEPALQRMGKAARQVAVERYSLEMIAERYEALYTT